jgi:alpha-beta hydrolase superfamily lysophospholipase
MRTYESSWAARDSIRLHEQGWEPDKKAKAVVALVHGLGEHAGRYAPVGAVLTRAGYALVGFDLRGHGRSGGPRGYIPSYDVLMDDLTDFLRQIGERHPRLPVFLYGHSLGGNLVINFSLRRKPQVRGVIATAPWLRLAHDPPALTVALARIMNGIAPGFTQKSGLDASALSQDDEIVNAYNLDPLVHDRISARLYVGAHDSGLWALEHAGEFSLPLLLMQGTADRLTSQEATAEFATRAGKNVKWRAWDGWAHEIHNEPDRARVYRVMINWMNERLRKK